MATRRMHRIHILEFFRIPNRSSLSSLESNKTVTLFRQYYSITWTIGKFAQFTISKINITGCTLDKQPILPSPDCLSFLFRLSSVVVVGVIVRFVVQVLHHFSADAMVEQKIGRNPILLFVCSICIVKVGRSKSFRCCCC